MVLPASKTDQQALGKGVVHGCACGPHSGCGCPFHAGRAQLDRLRRLFPEKFADKKLWQNMPLFPTAEGKTVEKEAMIGTIVEAAKKFETSLVSADGAARVSGHSLRVTGAQGLAKLGVDTWAIQLLGRWGQPPSWITSRRFPWSCPPSGPRRRLEE